MKNKLFNRLVEANLDLMKENERLRALLNPEIVPSAHHHTEKGFVNVDNVDLLLKRKAHVSTKGESYVILNEDVDIEGRTIKAGAKLTAYNAYLDENTRSQYTITVVIGGKLTGIDSSCFRDKDEH